ncbi:MAG TPA: hypothetical protein VMS98_08530 [Thermoanaerobaculia bacterium]|nr:hypothetical protein [Thermoanaerobaculia bacterium]
MAEDDFDSTLIRRGRKAVTFADMAQFVHTLESRPIATLLNELPEIARLSEAKLVLATKILRRRFEGESAVDQQQLRVFANEIAAGVKDADLAARIRGIFARFK